MAVQFPAKAQSMQACPLPLGGAVAQRLRGYKWRSEKSVKAIAPTGAALAFCASTSSLGLSRACSPWPVAGWVESRGREGGLGTPLPASGPAERPCPLLASRNFPCEACAFQILPTQNGCCTFLCSSRFIVFIPRLFSVYPVPASARCSQW